MRLANDRLIQLTFRQGQKNDSDHFSIYQAGELVTSTQFCFRVPKKFGTAPCRNRIKRLMREFVRTNKELWPMATAIILSPKTGAAALSFQQVSTELKQIFAHE